MSCAHWFWFKSTVEDHLVDMIFTLSLVLHAVFNKNVGKTVGLKSYFN